MNIFHSRHLIAVGKGNMVEYHFALNPGGFQCAGILLILHINPLIQHFKHSFARSFGLRIVVDMEAKPPHRADDIPDETEESYQFPQRHLIINDKRSADSEQNSDTHRSEQLHHREEPAPQLSRKNLVILITFITVREFLDLIRLSGE
ncbi:hypothetical protein D3C73_1010690 [compost metagenome]